jgi:MFS family permease
MVQDPGRARRRLLAGVSTNVLVLGIVSLLTDMSSEMVYPILPLFLTSIGASGLVIGLIEGAAETTASLVKVISGWYSDKFNKRKKFVLSGYTLSSATKPLLALAINYWQVLGLRIVERIGKGIRSAPRDALIADSTAPERRGKAFGFHKALDSTGAVLGPLLALPVLLTAAAVTTDTYRLIFLLSAIPAFVAVMVIVLFLREKEGDAIRKPSRFIPELKRMGGGYWSLMAVVGVFFLGEVSYAFFVLQGLAIGLSDVEIILFYVLFNFTFVLLAIPSGSLSDRVGRKPIIALSFVLFACTCATMAMADRWWVLGLGFVLYGLYKGTSEGVFKAFVTDVAPAELRATALGGYYTVIGLVMLPGGLFIGLLWDSVGDWAAFAFGIVTSLVALMMMISFSSLKRPNLTGIDQM